MAENPATLAHVVNSFERPLTNDEQRVVPDWLRQAWNTLRFHRDVPALEVRMDLADGEPGRLDSELVQDVLVAMVERKLRNPEGLRTFGIAGDYDQTVDQALSSGQLYVSEEEIARLQPATYGAATGGFYSIPFGR